MKKTILSLLVFALGGAAWASTDLKAYLEAQTITGEFNSWTAGETYTLDEDCTLKRSDTGAKVGMRFGRNCTYEFKDGVTFSLGGNVRFYGDSTSSTFTLKGGTWDFGGVGCFDCGGWYNLPYSGYAWDVDGVIITNQGTWTCFDGYGHDRTLRMKNSTVYIGGSYVDFFPAVSDANVDKAGGVSSLAEFGPNTKLIGTLYVYDNRNNTSPVLQNGILRFKGAGTVYSGLADGSRGTSYLSIGSNKASPGYRMEVLDGALVNVWAFHFGETSWSNSVFISNAAMTNEYAVDIGLNATATDNSLTVNGADGTCCFMNNLTVGTSGSRTSLVVTNGASVIVAKALSLGNGDAVSNTVLVADQATLDVAGGFSIGKDAVRGGNEFHVEQATLKLVNTVPVQVFGCGNSLVLDDAAVMAKEVKIGKSAVDCRMKIGGETSLSFLRPGTYAQGGTIWYPLGASSDGSVVELTDGVELSMARLHWDDTSSNATLRITNNAKVEVAEYFWMGANGSATNAVCEISNGGMLTGAGIRTAGNAGAGIGNKYVVDNGTIRFSGSQGVYLTGDGAMCVRGVTPKVVAYNDASAQCQFRDRAQVTIELPTNGQIYAEAPFQGYAVSWHATAGLHIKNVEECFAALNCSTNIPLVRKTAAGKMSAYIPQAVVDAANAELPDYACVVYTEDNNGLDLRLKKTSGMIFLISGPVPVPVALTFDDGCPGQLQVAEPMITARGWKGTFNICTGWSGPNVMTWDQIRELHNRGHEIASHSSKHPRLTELIDAGDTERLNEEIGGSRQKLIDEIGVAPTWFCTPYIEYRDDLNALVEAAGMHIMTIPRIPFGDGYPPDKDYTKKLMNELAKKPKALDILIHGITKEYGGWNPFENEAEFARFLDSIKALEDKGLIKIVTYAEAYEAYNNK